MRFILVKENKMKAIEMDTRKHGAITYALSSISKSWHGAQDLLNTIGSYRKENDVLGTLIISVEQFLLIMIALHILRTSLMEDFKLKTREEVCDYIYNKGNAELTYYELREELQKILDVKQEPA